ncbi:MAG: hypothetical protein ACRDLS_17185 [Solirubrobacteraceae bacterium]
MEILKLRVTPSLRAALLAAPAVALAAVALDAAFTDPGLETIDSTFESASAGRFAILVLGVLAVGGEFHHGTIDSVFSGFPRRVEVMEVKSFVIAAAAALAGAVAVVAGDALAALVLTAKSVDIDISAGQLIAVGLGTIGAYVMWGLAGVALGAVAASQSGGLLLAFGALLANSVFQGLVTIDVARLLPLEASAALTGSGQEGGLTAAAAVLVLGVWVSALMTAAAWRVTRLDIT